MPHDLMKDLAALAREEQSPPAGDDRLDALMRGELHADEERRLHEEIGTSEQGRTAYEASRPFDKATKKCFLAQARKELQASRSAPEEEAENDLHDVVEPPANVVALGGRSRMMAVAGALLAAAAVILLLMRPAQTELPAYDFRVAGGEQSVRSPGATVDARPVLGPGSALQLLLRPSVPSKSPVAARVFVATDASFADGRVVDAKGVYPLELTPEISSEGAVRVDVPGEAIARHFRHGGAWIIVALARPDALPSTASELANPNGVQLFSRPIEVRER